MPQRRPERMEAAGSLTPDLEGAARTSAHEPRRSACAPAEQKQPSGGSKS